MITEKITGYFDCRTYKPNTEKSKQPMKAEGENITFTCVFKAKDCPRDLAEGCKPYSKNGTDMVAVKFKVSKTTRWYNANAEQVAKPLNTELDGKRYNVRIDFRRLNGDASKLEPTGNWVNAIQFEEVEENPFTAFVKGGAVSGEAEAATEAPEVKDDAKTTETNDLPF